MDFSDPGLLFSSFVIGLLGMGLFIYGKKSEQPKSLLAGIVLCVYPIFVHSLLLMWGLAALCLAGVWFLPRTD